MGTKMAVAFANIFMAKIEKEILSRYSDRAVLSPIKPIFWKRFIDDVISVWDTSRNETSILQSNSRLKYQKQRLHSWTRRCTKVSDSTRMLSLTCEHTSSLQRHSNTRISIRVTDQASQKASSKEKL